MLALNTKQRAFFQAGHTRPLAFRLAQLDKLEAMILNHETEWLNALAQDLSKSATEAKLTELNIVLDEIRHTRAHLWKWMKTKKVKTPFPSLWRGKSTVRQQPFGTTLVIAPWNFPFQLSLAPLAAAIAGGNTVVLKPSPLAKHTHDLLIQRINETFQEEHIHAVSLTDTECDTLLECPWDYVFFTGSPRIGKHVLQKIAPNLTPATLELGGKSPCIVDDTANIQQAAKHIVWAKFLNAGQVCIAPDFIAVHESVHDALIEALIQTIQHYYGDDPSKSTDYGRIINESHYQRLMHLLENASVAHGGRHQDKTRYIEPTLVDHVTWQDPIMQDEIFGPLLPIVSYSNPEALIQALMKKPSPLAFYVFSKDKVSTQHLMNALPFGNGAINTCILQYTNLNLPFGGVGNSGMGRYHGEYSFKTFTYAQSCYERYAFPDITLHHPPYTARKLKWLWRLLRL